MLIHCLDDKPYDTYGREVNQAAIMRGHKSGMFSSAEQVGPSGYVFMRLHQWVPRLNNERLEARVLRLRDDLKFIQDEAQLEVYEDKLAQTDRWHEWMPHTAVLYTEQAALEQLDFDWAFPIVSKSSTGSASHNVRILKNREAAAREVYHAFRGGLPVIGGGGTSRQKGYVYWQEFIPHTETWRVAAVGTKRHVYKRFNYDDRPVAAPSKVKPTQPVPMCAEVESLLEFSNRFFEAAGTKWCAIDVLRRADGAWRLLETSLAWARGNDKAGNAPFYGTKYSLNTQHQLLIEEIEAGVFG